MIRTGLVVVLMVLLSVCTAACLSPGPTVPAPASTAQRR